MRTPVFLVRYGDMVKEMTGESPKYDTMFGYSEQYDFALPKNSVVFGKRSRFAREKIGERIYYVFPFLPHTGGKIKTRFLRILGELYEFFLLLRHRPRLIVVVGAPIDMIIPFIFSRLFGISLITVFHDEIPPQRIFSKIAAKIVNARNAIAITNGELPRDRLISLGAPPEKIIVHRVYYPPEFFTEKPIEPGITNSPKFKVFYIGRFTQEKGVTDLPKVVKLVSENLNDKVEFYFIGDGPLVEQVKRQIHGYSLENVVKFLGMRPSDMIYSYLRAADVVIVPSYMECFGKILAEAMISGTPAVAYATGGLKYQITDGVDGFLVPTGDYEAMAQRIVELYKNPQLRKKIAQNAAKVRKKYEDINQTLGYILKREIDRILAESD